MAPSRLRFKKVLLINPPGLEQSGYTPSPLGILYLATYLSRKVKGVEVDLIDGAKEGKEAVINKLSQFKPDLVGISALTPSRHQALYVATLAKHYFPHCKIVLGGYHPTLMWEQVMENFKVVDYIVRGEGELTLAELVRGFSQAEIGSLVWRRGKKIVANPERLPIKNLDRIPFPDWGMINPLSYPARGKGTVNGINLTKEPPIPIAFSRGCIGSCTFCSTWRMWKGYRFRRGKNVADEVEILFRKFHVKHLGFQDDTLTGNRKEMIIFCNEILKRKIQMAFIGCTRVDCVDEELLKLMKKAGFYEISYGIETASPAMLKRINKKTDLQRNIDAAKWTKKAKLRLCLLMMFGLPGETEEDRRLSYQFINKTKPFEVGSLGVVWIFPGTLLYLQAKNAGLINDSFWLGKRPYYIYRGGLFGDPLQRKQLIKDWYEFYIEGTNLGKLLHPLLIFKRRFLNVWLFYLRKTLNR